MRMAVSLASWEFLLFFKPENNETFQRICEYAENESTYKGYVWMAWL